MKPIVFALFLLTSGLAKGQCAQSLVDLRCNPCTITDALDILEGQVSCTFSYNAGNIDGQKLIYLNLQKAPLHQALKLCFDNKLDLKQRGRHLILMPVSVNHEKQEKRTYKIEGYVRNAQTGEIVDRATIYAIDNKYSTLSDDRGFYQLRISADDELIGLNFSRQAFYDTIIVIEPTGEALRQDIILNPRAKAPSPMPRKYVRLEEKTRQVEELPMVKLLVPEVQAQRALNIEFLEQIPVQLSLTPAYGTNKLTSGNKENILSLNVIGGYNAGVKGFEAGGAVNIIRQDVRGLQAAGIGNIVGGKVRGIQVGGVFNNVRGSIIGFQAGGIYNLVLDTIIGVQAGGVFNILNGTISGAQLGGVFNVATENMAGLQAGGVFNVTKGAVKYAQVAGVFNSAGETQGAQIAGVFNHSRGDISGTQISGVFNRSSGNVSGVQVAGVHNSAKDVVGNQFSALFNLGRDVSGQVSALLNIARKVNGTQIGFLNIADTSALSIGFLSISLKGFNHLDVTADEAHYLNTSYRTGNRVFYNIFQFGYGSYYPVNLLSLGYGLGTTFRPPEKRVQIHLETMARQFVDRDNDVRGTNLNLRLEPSLSIKIGRKRPSFVLGPSVNLLVQDKELLSAMPEQPYPYPPIFAGQSSNIALRYWIGAKCGLRI